MPAITRCLSDKNCARAKQELAFLIDYLDHPKVRGELAIEFRGSSELGVYDRGFRLAQVKFSRDGGYQVTTNLRFIDGSPLQDNPRFPAVIDEKKNSATFGATPETIHALLQMSHITSMRSRIKGIRYKEEIGVAHVIATDTVSGTDVVVIDREVGDSGPEHLGERLDLLALQQVRAGEYRFLAIEVKLGNNPELDTEAKRRAGERSAVEQVEGYVEQIGRYFDDYSACYRKNIEQKLELGLLSNWQAVPTIVNDTRAMLVVVGYSGIARPYLDVIARDHKDLWVKTFDYGLRSHNGTIVGLM